MKISAAYSPLMFIGPCLLFAFFNVIGIIKHLDKPFLYIENILSFFVSMSVALLFIYYFRKFIYFILFIEKTIKIEEERIIVSGRKYYFDDVTDYKIIKYQIIDVKIVAIFKDEQEVEVYKYSSKYEPFLNILQCKYGKREIIKE